MSVSTVVTEGFSTGSSLGRSWFVVTEGYGQLFVIETADSVLSLLGTITDDGLGIRGKVIESAENLDSLISEFNGLSGAITGEGLSARAKIENIVISQSGEITGIISMSSDVDGDDTGLRSKVDDYSTNRASKI